jgi:hypothetical protein
MGASNVNTAALSWGRHMLVYGASQQGVDAVGARKLSAGPLHEENLRVLWPWDGAVPPCRWRGHGQGLYHLQPD